MTEKQAPPLFNELSEKFSPSTDIIQTPLHIKGEYAFLFFLKSVVDGDNLQKTVIRPFFEMASADSFKSYIQSLPINEQVPIKDKLMIQISAGYVLLAINDELFLLDLRLVKNSEIQDTVMEPTIHGPQKALSENIEVSINALRQRYHKSSFTVESIVFNDEPNTTLAIIYDSEHADPAIVKRIKEQLKSTESPLIQSAGDLQHFFNKSKYTLFPTTLVTERPDRVVYNLVGGKIGILIDGSPNVIITPAIFYDFMASMEDNYHVSLLKFFTVVLRYIGLFTCVLLPSMYVAMTSYNPDILRIELALTVAGSRIGVPYPSFVEVLFMLFFMELLTEASMRLPKSISSTATTVGGLILGTAATEAALVSNIMVIIISAVAISTFVIPINEMSFTTRITRVLLLVFTSLFGMVGLLIGFIGLVMLLANKESFGVPYLRIPWKTKRQELRMDTK